MFQFFTEKKYKKIISRVLNSQITYIILLFVILMQFALVSIIFFQNKKSTAQTNAKLNLIEMQQNNLDAKINTANSYIMRMQAQLYRMQGGQ